MPNVRATSYGFIHCVAGIIVMTSADVLYSQQEFVCEAHWTVTQQTGLVDIIAASSNLRCSQRGK